MDRCFLVQVNIGGKPTEARVRKAAVEVSQILSAISPEYILANKAKDGSTFGVIVKCNLNAWELARAVLKSDSRPFDEPLNPTTIGKDDSVLVLELNQNAASYGPERAATWVKNHHPGRNPATKVEAAPAESKAPSKLASQLAEKLGKRGKS